MDADELTFLRAIREGVVGYVLKDASAIELVSTISRWPRKKQSAHHP
jgi:hypothetical protein